MSTNPEQQQQTPTAARRKRVLVHGANAFAVTIASIGIAVVGYILVDRYRPFRIDMTASGLYGLSPRTLDILEEIPGEVSITFFELPASEVPGANVINDQVSELLEEYRVRSGGKIEVRTVNPLREPLLMEELGADYASAVFRRGDEKVIVTGKEIYEVKFDGFGDEPSQKFTGEEAFSSALLRLAEGGTGVACFLTGHGEIDVESQGADGYSELLRVLRNNNLASRPVSLEGARGGGSLDAPFSIDAGGVTPPAAMAEVPADCTVLVIPGPTKGAFSDAEIDAVVRHFDAGRGVVVMLESRKDVRAGELVKRFGLHLQPGVVIDAERMVQSPINVVPAWEPHAITETLEGAGINVVTPDPVAFVRAPDPDPTITLTSIMRSSEQSLVVTEIKDGKADPRSPKNIPGPASLGFAVEKQLADGRSARAVILGDADFATNGLLQSVGSGSLLFAETTINWAAGSRKKLDIGPKDPDLAVIGPELTESGATLLFLATGLMLPATILSTGVWVWQRRRSR